MQALAAYMGPQYTAPMVMHHIRLLQPRVTGKWQPAEDAALKQVCICLVNSRLAALRWWCKAAACLAAAALRDWQVAARRGCCPQAGEHLRWLWPALAVQYGLLAAERALESLLETVYQDSSYSHAAGCCSSA